MLISSSSFCIFPLPAFLFNGNFQFVRSLLGNTPKQRAKPNMFISLCDKKHVGSTLLFFFLSVPAQYSSLLLPTVVSVMDVCYSAECSQPLTSCSYLSLFVCLALGGWGWGCVYSYIYIFIYIYVTLLLSFLFKIEYQ